jgi:hypothetical protein
VKRSRAPEISKDVRACAARVRVARGIREEGRFADVGNWMKGQPAGGGRRGRSKLRPSSFAPLSPPRHPPSFLSHAFATKKPTSASQRCVLLAVNGALCSIARRARGGARVLPRRMRLSNFARPLAARRESSRGRQLLLRGAVCTVQVHVSAGQSRFSVRRGAGAREKVGTESTAPSLTPVSLSPSPPLSRASNPTASQPSHHEARRPPDSGAG